MDKVLRDEEVREALKNGAVLYQDHGGGRRTYYWLNTRMFPVPEPRIYEMVISRALDENDPEYDDLDEIGDELDYFIRNYGSHGYLVYKSGYRKEENEPEKEGTKVRTVKGEEALKLLRQGAVMTDGDLFYWGEMFTQKDGTELFVVQVYKTLIGHEEPAEVLFPSKAEDELKNKELHEVYLTAREAKDAMLNGYSVMDSNGYIHFADVVKNKSNPTDIWSCVFSLNDNNFPQVDCSWIEFEDEFEDEDSFIIYHKLEEME